MATETENKTPVDRNFIKKFLKGSAATSLGTLATVVFHFVSIALMTRYVDQDQLGLYFLILAIANGGKTIGSLGLDLSLVRFLSSDQESLHKNAFLATMIVRIAIMAVLSLIVLGLGSLILPLFGDGVLDYILYIPALFILMSFRELFFFLLQGLNQFRNYAVVQTASAFLKTALIVLLSHSLDITTLLYIEFAMLGSSMVIQFIVIPFRELLPEEIKLDYKTMREIIGFGFPLYINSLLTYVSNFGGTFIVGLFLSTGSIAAYEVAAKIPQGVNRLLQSFSTVYFPSLSSFFARNDLENAVKLINKSLVILASGTFATVLGALVFRHEIIVTVFVEKYAEVEPTFVLLMLSICLQLLAFTMGYSLVAAGHPEKSTKVNIVVMGSELLMSLIFVPLMGYVGVAVSFVIQTLIAQVLCYYYLLDSNIKIDVNAFIRPYLILAGTAIVFLLSPQTFFIKVATLFAYVVLSIVLIPDCLQAIQFAWHTFQEILRGRKSVQPAESNS